MQKARLNFLDAVLAEALKHFQVHAAKKKIDLDLQVNTQNAFITVDEEKIKKVMSVLISNAITYSPEGSTVTIDVKSDKQKLAVTVEDEGFGVPKPSRKDIFEMFYRGEQARRASPEGLGVNLFIARHFINAHHGKLVVADRADGRKGAHFSFSLPMR